MKILKASILTLVIFISTISSIDGSIANSPISVPEISYASNSATEFVAAPAKWSQPTRTRFEWFLDGKPIKKANSLQINLAVKDLGKTLQFREISLDSKNLIASSSQVKVGHVIIKTAPSIVFSDDAKKSLKIIPGRISPMNAKVKYQWYRGFIDIAGQSKESYSVATFDQGAKISVNARYSAKGFKDNSIDSNEIEISILERKYSEIWREDFDYTPNGLPNPKIWSPENGDGSNTPAGGGWGNRERQYYIPSQAQISEQGILKINASRNGADSYNCYYKKACEWISAKYITKEKIGFKYGRIEARIKGPIGAGTWGAFWMLGADIDVRRWPWCGEIDVVELVGKDPNLVYGYLHGLLSGGNGGRGSTTQLPNGFAEEFHTYSVDWLPDQINWYVDGVLFGSQPKVDKDWVFDHEFYLILNLAMGGNLGGNVETSLGSATMEVDWIKVSSINGVGEIIRH